MKSGRETQIITQNSMTISFKYGIPGTRIQSTTRSIDSAHTFDNQVHIIY